MATVFSSVDEVLELVGKELGETDWLEITQDRVNGFADATGDHQWIHVDPERAREGPFGVCIAHGYLTLALAGSFFLEQIAKANARMGVNYGLEKVRFPAPVRVGARIRGRGMLLRAERVEGGVQAVIRVTVDIEGSERPACVADTMSRYYFD